MSRFLVALPGFFDPPAESRRRAFSRHPAWRALVRHVDSSLPLADDPLAWLCIQLGIARQNDTPVAPILAASEGLDVAQGYWLIAEPVTLEAGLTRVRLTDPPPVLRDREAALLVDLCNGHFAIDGIRFVSAPSGRCYARVDRTPALVTQSPAAARALGLPAALPAGAEGALWRRRQNETQMLLHEHPLNNAREAAGEALISSVWLWGGGTLPPRGSAATIAVVTGDAIVAAIARFAGAGVAAIDAEIDSSARRGDTLVMVDADDAVAANFALPRIPAASSFVIALFGNGEALELSGRKRGFAASLLRRARGRTRIERELANGIREEAR